MKKNIFILCFLIIISSFDFSSFADEKEEENTNTKSEEISFNGDYIIYELETDRLLYASDIDADIKISSNINLLNALYALSKKKAMDKFIAPNEFIAPSGNSIAVDYGEEFVLGDLIASMLIYKSNDANMVIYTNLAKNIKEYIYSINEYAKSIGMNDSKILEAYSQSYELDKSKTSFKDLVMLYKEINSNEFIKKLLNTKRHIIPPSNKKEDERNYIFQSNPFVFDEEVFTEYMNSDRLAVYMKNIQNLNLDYFESKDYQISNIVYQDNQSYLVVSKGRAASREEAVSNHRKIIEYAIRNYKYVDYMNQGFEIDKSSSPDFAEIDERFKIKTKSGLNVVIKSDDDKDKALSLRVKADINDYDSLKNGDLIGDLELIYQDEIVAKTKLFLVGEEKEILGVLQKTKKKKSVYEIIFQVVIFIFQVLLTLYIWIVLVTKRKERKRRKDKEYQEIKERVRKQKVIDEFYAKEK